VKFTASEATALAFLARNPKAPKRHAVIDTLSGGALQVGLILIDEYEHRPRIDLLKVALGLQHWAWCAMGKYYEDMEDK